MGALAAHSGVCMPGRCDGGNAEVVQILLAAQADVIFRMVMSERGHRTGPPRAKGIMFHEWLMAIAGIGKLLAPEAA